MHQITITGLLDSVNDLAVEPINSTTIKISWSPPFTLDQVPILGYTVTITNVTSGENEVLEMENTTTTNYVFAIDDPDPGDNFTVTVTVCEYCVTVTVCEYCVIVTVCEYCVTVTVCEYCVTVTVCEYCVIVTVCEYCVTVTVCVCVFVTSSHTRKYTAVKQNRNYNQAVIF